MVTLKPGAEASEAELRAFVADRLAAFKGAGEGGVLARDPAAQRRTARS
ncbi:hypothetical protein ACRAWD_11670 [Caulobacter segnis]